MHIELILGLHLIRNAEMQQVLRASALGKLAGIFDERIHGVRDLPIQEKSGLSGDVSTINLGRPVQRELSGGGPIGGKLSRPWQLQPRIVSVARYRRGAGGDAEDGDDRHIESIRRSKLLFDSDGQIAKARSDAGGSDGIVII